MKPRSLIPQSVVFLLIDGGALFIVPYKFCHSVFFEEFLFLKFFSFDLFLRSEIALAVDLCKKHVEASVFFTQLLEFIISLL